MKQKGLLIALTISALLHGMQVHADSVRHQMAQRGAIIETLKQHGLVVEQPDGFLGTVSNDPEIIELINKENADRKARHDVIIEEQCREKWVDNYRMQTLCRQQKAENK